MAQISKEAGRLIYEALYLEILNSRPPKNHHRRVRAAQSILQHSYISFQNVLSFIIIALVNIIYYMLRNTNMNVGSLCTCYMHNSI